MDNFDNFVIDNNDSDVRIEQQLRIKIGLNSIYLLFLIIFTILSQYYIMFSLITFLSKYE
jgi:hypothetical protein